MIVRKEDEEFVVLWFFSSTLKLKLKLKLSWRFSPQNECAVVSE